MSRVQQPRITPPASPPPEAKPAEEPAPPGRLPLIGALIFALLAEGLLVFALVLAPGSGSGLELLKLGDLVISGLFALGSCFLAGIVVRGRERVAWLLLGIACLGVLVAQGARLFSLQGLVSLIPAGDASLPSVSALALAAQNILLFLALLALPAARKQRRAMSRVRQFFDGALVVSAAALGAFYFLLAPLAPGSAASTGWQAPTLTIGVDLLLLGGLTFALRAASAHQRPLRSALRWLIAVVLLLLAADVISTLQMLDQPLDPASPLQAVLNAAYLSLGLSAMIRLRGEGQARREESGRTSGSLIGQTLPSLIVVLTAGTIGAFALITPGEKLTALVCLALLVALVGARYLISMVEAHQLEHENLSLAQELARMNEEFDYQRARQQTQATRLQTSLQQMQESLAYYLQGQYDVRLPSGAGELAPLAAKINLLLDGNSRQLQEQDRSREHLVIHTLVDALGRLALGELHDLPDLPPPTGTPVDALARGIIQVRARLLNLHATIQQHQAEYQRLEGQLTALQKHLAQEVQGEHLLLIQMNESLEAQVQAERQIAQAAEEQVQQARRSGEARIQAAEARAQEAEAALVAAEERLRLDYDALERRAQAERAELDERLRSVQPPDPAHTARLRQQGGVLVGLLSSQSERLHTAAAALQTAAEVARRLANSIEETVALPGLLPVPSAAPVPTVPPAGSPSLSAMHLLEQLAGIRAAEAAAPAPPSTASQVPSAANQEIITRLHTAASRADEMAGGLQDLAAELIKEGHESKRGAEHAEHLTTDLEQPARAAAPATLRARVAARPTRTERQ